MENYPKDVHIDFILERMREGEKWKKVRRQFLEKWSDVSGSTFSNRWSAAQQLFEKEHQEIQAMAALEIAKRVERLKDSIMTSVERQIVLSEMARGEITVEKPIVVNKELKYVEREPELYDRRNAIAELNKMDGTYTKGANAGDEYIIVGPKSEDD